MQPLLDAIPTESASQFNIDPLWRVADVARYLQVTEETVRTMARKGTLPALKIGKSWRFHQKALEAWVIQMGKSGEEG